MRPHSIRRLVILTEGQFGVHNSKTAIGVIRYGRDDVVAVLDSAIAGRNVSEWLGPRFDIPAVATLDEAIALGADALLIGIAPTGGRLPDAWRATISQALHARLDVLSGLHTFLADDPEFASAAATTGAEIVDYRRVPDRHQTANGRPHRPGSHVILTVGSDCAIGKMTVALELERAANEAGLRGAFVPTGQTGMMIAGWGVSVDREISDFLAGTCEWLVEQGEEMGDWVFVEGQGSIDHPAYSPVTLGLIHGCTPHAMVLVHKVGLTEHDFEHITDASYPIKPLTELIPLHETIAGMVVPARVVAVALNTSDVADDDEARRIIRETEAETGLPVDDPVRFGPARLFGAVRSAVEEGIA